MKSRFVKLRVVLPSTKSEKPNQSKATQLSQNCLNFIFPIPLSKQINYLVMPIHKSAPVKLDPSLPFIKFSMAYATAAPAAIEGLHPQRQSVFHPRSQTPISVVHLIQAEKDATTGSNSPVSPPPSPNCIQFPTDVSDSDASILLDSVMAASDLATLSNGKIKAALADNADNDLAYSESPHSLNSNDLAPLLLENASPSQAETKGKSSPNKTEPERLFPIFTCSGANDHMGTSFMDGPYSAPVFSSGHSSTLSLTTPVFDESSFSSARSESSASGYFNVPRRSSMTTLASPRSDSGYDLAVKIHHVPQDSILAARLFGPTGTPL